MEEDSSGSTPMAGTTMGMAPSPETEAPAQMPVAEGRRTQLKIVRENIDNLSNDVGSFRRSHEKSIKKLEAQVASLRDELAAAKLSKDLGGFRKSHDSSSKRLEKQVATLRSDLAALKSSIARDAARSRARQEAALSKILAKVSAKPKAAKPAKASKKKK